MRAGYCAIIGPPNVGKSTFLNQVLGVKLAITSDKPQTTRHRLLGIHHEDGAQIAFLDTPGLHQGEKALNRRLQQTALDTLAEVDAALFLADVMPFHLEEARAALALETPKELSNVTIRVTGSVSTLCRSAAETCRTLGYAPTVLSEAVQDEARAFGAQLARLAREHQDSPRSLAFIAGGETVVRVTGTGLGGRNQEVALAAAIGIAGCRDTCVFSVGSDGTDGPTDAAGGYVDGDTIRRLAELNLNAASALSNNDAYHALSPINGLIMTGPTGTNVNDLVVLFTY